VLPGPRDYFESTINIRNNPSAQDLASNISIAINYISQSGGPPVYTTVSNNCVFFNYDDTRGINLQYSGSLSSPRIDLQDVLTGGRRVEGPIAGNSFIDQVTGSIFLESLNNFSNLFTLSTADLQDDDSNFEVSSKNAVFDINQISISKLSTLNGGPNLPQPSDVDAHDTVFIDESFSNIDSYLYLPPIVKVSDESFSSRLNSTLSTARYRTNVTKADIPSLLESDNQQVQSIMNEYLLAYYPAVGRNSPMKFAGKNSIQSKISEFGEACKKEIVFNQTSSNNNLLGQFFEIVASDGNSVVRKLELVDYGTVTHSDGSKIRVFFVGKTFLDTTGATVFVKIFTLAFSKEGTVI
jgi:hypothetical protein